MENFSEESRCYLEHIHSERSRIHQFLRNLRSALFDSRSEPIKSVIEHAKPWLVKLREELKKHFSEEDSGGCVEEAVSRLPSLASEANKLAKQHPRLLSLLDKIIEQMEHHKIEFIERNELEDSILDFSVKLMEYEAVENLILQKGLNVAADVLDDIKFK